MTRSGRSTGEPSSKDSRILTLRGDGGHLGRELEDSSQLLDAGNNR